MRLSTRLALMVAVLAALFGLLSALALYDSVKNASFSNVRQRLSSRLAWVSTSINNEDERLEMEPRDPPANSADFWRVLGPGGTVLWSELPNSARQIKRSETLSAIKIVGDADGPQIASPKPYKDSDNGSGRVEYVLPSGKHRLELTLEVFEDAGQQQEELARLRLALWMFVPAGVVLLGLILAWFIRWQLKPLNDIAHQASRINVGKGGSLDKIQSHATSREIVDLKQAINSLIGRMEDGLAREKNFAAFAAHELRTPLAQMRTHVEVTLRRERPVAEYQSCLTESLTDIDRLQGLVAGLLALSRAGSENAPPLEKLNLRQTVEAAAKQSGAIVDLSRLPETELVDGHGMLLTAAIANVFENAKRYASGSELTVSVAKTATETRLLIEDSGPGIPTQDHERIFEPLMRLESARSITSEKGGYGLGLAVARAVCRAAGGDLICSHRADDNPGASFTFIFRVASAL